jgi:N-sulfoglucosamine sulfohydrolase
MQKRYNVLYIISHDQGIAASCFSGAGPDANSSLKTPGLQRLADAGTCMMNHYGSTPMCSPARSSLMTSSWPHENGITGLTHMGWGYTDKFRSQTVVHAFAKAGYRTAIVGFQHEIEPYKSKFPTEDEYMDLMKEIGYQEGYAYPGLHGSHIVGELTEDILEELAEGDAPWWLSVGTGDVHRPYALRTDLVPIENVSDEQIPSYLPKTDDVREDVADFQSMVARYDKMIVRILNTLDRLKLWDNTIVIWTTDHGVAIPGAKGLLYDPSCHTGMLFAHNPTDEGKGMLKQGNHAQALVSSLDFAPTICDLCDVDPMPDWRGKSYKNIISNNSEDIDNPTAINEYIFNENTFADKYNPIRSVRTPEWRFIRNYVDYPIVDGPPGDVQKSLSYPDWREMIGVHPRPEEEMYNIIDDPDCRRNLIKETKDHPMYIKLSKILDDHLENTDDLIRKGPYPVPSQVVCDNADDFPHLKGHKREKLHSTLPPNYSSKNKHHNPR